MISCPPGCDGKVDSSLWLQHEFNQYINIIPVVNGTQPVVTQDVGQHGLHLQHCELLAYAIPGTSAEGDVGVWVSVCCPLWQEVVRVELLRVWEMNRVPMDAVDIYDNCASRRDVVARWKKETKLKSTYLLTLSDPTSNIVRQYDFPVPL
jgi:hypothetical protein